MARLVKSSTAEGGFVFYDGPSIFDGQRIVAIALLSSGNAKTGNLVQTVMIRPDRNTNDARRDGSDESVCADCEQRPYALHTTGCGGGCYVSAQMLGTIWKGYERGLYRTVEPQFLMEAMDGRFVRVGTYGDPAALPVEVWWQLLEYAPLWTGYTRQWRQGVNWPIPETESEFKRRESTMQQFCMASVFDPPEYAEATEAGWRTFRTRPPVLNKPPYQSKKGKVGKGKIIYPPNYFKHRDRNSPQWQRNIQYWPEPGTEEAGPRAGLLWNEDICPATDEWIEAGHKKTLHCLDCLQCSGTTGKYGKAPNRAIRSHGTTVLRTPTIEGLHGLGASSAGCQAERRLQLGCFGPDPEFYY